MGQFTAKNKEGKDITIISPNYAACPVHIPEEKWNSIFSGKEEFEKKYGKIVKMKMIGMRKTYEYVDHKDGEIKWIEIGESR